MDVNEELLVLSQQTVFSYDILKSCLDICCDDIDLLRSAVKMSEVDPALLGHTCYLLRSFANGGFNNGFA